jgi:hypothetical protein
MSDSERKEFIYQLYKAEKTGEETVLEVLERAYNQGRSSALKERWRKYPDEKPEKTGKYIAIFHGVPNYWYELYYDQHLKYWLNGQGGKDLNITHWQPITLPETESKETKND